MTPGNGKISVTRMAHGLSIVGQMEFAGCCAAATPMTDFVGRMVPECTFISYSLFAAGVHVDSSKPANSSRKMARYCCASCSGSLAVRAWLRAARCRW